MPKSNYANIVKDLAKESTEPIMVTVCGQEFPLNPPSKYAYISLMNSIDQSDSVQSAVKAMQLFLPGQLSEDETFNILSKDGFFKAEGELFNAFNTYNDAVLGEVVAEAADSPEADADF